MTCEKLFDEYQKLISSADKLEFLHDCLKKYNEDKCLSNILNCLIALEDNFINVSNIGSDGCIVKFYKEYFSNDKDNKKWWLFTEGIIYYRLGKYDLENCLEAEALFGRFFSKIEEKPSYYLFYLGHVYYEIGKMESDIAKSEENLNKALECFKEIETNYSSLGNSYMAIIYNMLGNISMKLENLSDKEKSYKEAEEFYLKAKDKNEDFAFLYNGLGNINRECGNYVKAIEYYITATIKDKDFVYPWNYLGDCFRQLEKYEIAYNCYEQAIKICKDKSVIFPMYGIGRIYYELGNRNNNNEKYYEKAITYFLSIKEKVVTNSPQKRFALKDLGMAYQKLCKYPEAIAEYKTIINQKLFSKQKNYEKLIRASIADCNVKIKFKKNCSSLSVEKNGQPLHYVMCQTLEQKIEERVNDMKESFGVNFLRREKIKIEEFNKIKSKCSSSPVLSRFVDASIKDEVTCLLHILRRWNSYTPIVSNGRGGGYYLKVNDIGIVIDPGFNFIKSFKEAKHKFSDIDIILMSHAHDDHTADLESILSLQHRYNKLLKKIVLPRELAKERRTTSKDVMKEYNIEAIIEDRYLNNKKRLVLYTSEGVLKKFSGILAGKFKQVHENNYFDTIRKNKEEYVKNNQADYIEKDIFLKTLDVKKEVFINDGLKICAIKANHEDLIEDQVCLGFVIELENTIIVYTGDTGWYDKKRKENLQNQFEEINKENNKSKKIILIAHIGGFHEDENKYWNKKSNGLENKKMYYENHLGRIGLVKLVQTLLPDVCIISEFGEEFNGVRIKLTEIFQEAFEVSDNKINSIPDVKDSNDKIMPIPDDEGSKHKIKFIPGDIGLLINLGKKLDTGEETFDPKIKVISKIDFKNKTIIYEYVDPEEVAFGEYRDKNALFYYKKNSNVIEGDCIEAFISGFVDEDDVDSSSLKLDF